MPLEVIGAGFGRTGTLTLKTALERLGFGPCHHMIEVIGHPEQIPFWNRAAEGAAVEWDEVYCGYRATVDWPGCHFYDDLARYYPRAKVILSIRDTDRWYDSMRETILPTMELMSLNGADATVAESPMRFGGMIISQKTFNSDFSKANVVAAFERHNAEVRRRIPPDRLLVFEVAQGWEPLCDLLRVPVPAEPFPRVNDRQEFQTHAQRAQDLGQR
jgi:Sulfotransferase domain